MSDRVKMSTKRKELDDNYNLFGTKRKKKEKWLSYLVFEEDQDVTDSSISFVEQFTVETSITNNLFTYPTLQNEIQSERFSAFQTNFLSTDFKFRCTSYKGRQVSREVVFFAPSFNIIKRCYNFRINPLEIDQLGVFERIDYVVKDLCSQKEVPGVLEVNYYSREFEFDFKNLKVTNGRLIKIYFYIKGNFWTESEILCLREDQTLDKPSIYLKKIENSLKLQ